MDIKQLKALEAAATSRPWNVGRGIIINEAEYGGLNISRTATMADKGDDLELIATTRNMLPELIAVVEAAENYVEIGTKHPQVRGSLFRELANALDTLYENQKHKC
mgnify:CR=1 FL=1